MAGTAQRTTAQKASGTINNRCSTCKRRPRRKGQRTCRQCHNAYERERRARTTKELNDYRRRLGIG